MDDAHTARFPQWMHLRVPESMPDAIQRAARRRHQTGAEWARQALLRSLAAEGFVLGGGGNARDKGCPSEST
jgi:hypothetical protein